MRTGRLPADLLASGALLLRHDQLLGLPDALYAHALQVYCAVAALSDERRDRLHPAMHVEDLLWGATHMLELTPRQWERRRFADVHLDVEARVRDQTVRLARRCEMVAGPPPWEGSIP